MAVGMPLWLSFERPDIKHVKQRLTETSGTRVGSHEKRFGRNLMGRNSLGPRWADSFNELRQMLCSLRLMRDDKTKQLRRGLICSWSRVQKNRRLQLCSKFTGAAESLFVRALVNVRGSEGDV